MERDARGAEDLPVAGHARSEVQAAAVAPLDLAVLVHDEWTRADEAHLAAQDVQQLRQLVQRRAAQAPPDARDARVVAYLEQPVRLVPGREVGLHPVGAVDHRAELEHRETRAVLTDAG